MNKEQFLASLRARLTALPAAAYRSAEKLPPTNAPRIRRAATIRSASRGANMYSARSVRKIAER